MNLEQVVTSLREQRAETAEDLRRIDEALAALQRVQHGRPAARAPLSSERPQPKPRRRTSGPKPLPKAAKPKAAVSHPAAPLDPVDQMGRVPFGRGVQRAEFEDQDAAIGAARRLSERGYHRQRERPLKPGTFDLLRQGGRFYLVFVERAGDDTHSAREVGA